MKIAILGGGGCFGLNFSRLLFQRGVEHFGIGRSGPKAKAFWLAPNGYRFTALHLKHDLGAVMEILDRERPNIIVNFAAQGEGAASFGVDAWRFYDINCTALVSLVEQLRHRDYLDRFVHIGTSELYGSVDAPVDETAPYRPTSPYAISKAAFDQHLVTMHKIHGFPMTIIRPSNCYTPGQQLHRVIPKSIICGLTGRKLPLHGGGVARKSYLDALDLSLAIAGVIRVPKTIGKIYNVGPSEPTSIKDLLSVVASLLSKAPADLYEIATDRTGQDGCYWLNSDAIKIDTGWTQTVGIVQGVEAMVRWVSSYPELLTMDDTFQMRA